MKIVFTDATTGELVVSCSVCNGDCCGRCDREYAGVPAYCVPCARENNWSEGPSDEQARAGVIGDDVRKRGIR